MVSPELAVRTAARPASIIFNQKISDSPKKNIRRKGCADSLPAVSRVAMAAPTSSCLSKVYSAVL